MTERTPLQRQVGYGVAIGINIVMLVIAHNILEWGWVPFLTADFAQVLPWLTLSLSLTIAANVVYLFRDDRTTRSLGDLIVNLVSIATTLAMLRVFPFDFSAYQFDWAAMTRFVLVLGIIGSVIGAISALARLIRSESGTGQNVQTVP